MDLHFLAIEQKPATPILPVIQSRAPDERNTIRIYCALKLIFSLFFISLNVFTDMYFVI